MTHKKICIFSLENSRKNPVRIHDSRKNLPWFPQGPPSFPQGLPSFPQGLDPSLRDCNHFFQNILEHFWGTRKGPPTRLFSIFFSKFEDQWWTKMGSEKSLFGRLETQDWEWRVLNQCSCKRIGNGFDFCHFEKTECSWSLPKWKKLNFLYFFGDRKVVDCILRLKAGGQRVMVF